MIELLLQAERALNLGMVDQAERLYRQAIAADPRNSIAVVGLARVALERDDDVLAWSLAHDALAIDPENVAAQRLAVRLEEVHAYRGESLPAMAAARRSGDEAAAVEAVAAAEQGASIVVEPEAGAVEAGGAAEAVEAEVEAGVAAEAAEPDSQSGHPDGAAHPDASDDSQSLDSGASEPESPVSAGSSDSQSLVPVLATEFEADEAASVESSDSPSPEGVVAEPEGVVAEPEGVVAEPAPSEATSPTDEPTPEPSPPIDAGPAPAPAKPQLRGRLGVFGRWLNRNRPWRKD